MTASVGLEMLSINHGPIKVGQRLWNIGYPSKNGPVSYGGPLLAIQGGNFVIGAPAFPGMSGGAVVGCWRGTPVLMGIIESFNMREIENNRTIEEGKEIIERTTVNVGTSNAPHYMLLLMFTEVAIANLETREQELE